MNDEKICPVCNSHCGHMVIHCQICTKPMHLTPSSGEICIPCKQLGNHLRQQLLEAEPWCQKVWDEMRQRRIEQDYKK